MSKFLKFLQTNKIIECLKRKYHLNQFFQKEYIIDPITEILSILDNKGDTFFEHNEEDYSSIDLIGKLFESNVSDVRRKQFGQFYTPIHIVKYILKNIGYSSANDLESKKIIDLSCGCGSFLIQAVKQIIEFYLKKYNLSNTSKLPINKAKAIIKTIVTNIYGVDINPLACILCCINIYFSFFEIIKLVIDQEDNYKIPNLKVYNISALDYSNSNEFDFVVGNPPYIFIRDINKNERNLIERGNFDTNRGQYDYYQIFIELGIKTLKTNGYLGYILPDSILVLSNREIIRKFIFNHTKIREINYIGPSFEDPIVSNIIILLQKEADLKKRLGNRIKIKNKLISDKFEISIPQNTLKKWDYKFLVNLTEIDFIILKYLNDHFPKLKDIMNTPEFNLIIFRGIELGKEGKVIYCNNCNKYIPLPKINICRFCKSILDFKLEEEIIHKRIPKYQEGRYKPLLVSMNRYLRKKYKYIDITKKGINYKSLDNYSNRIVIRQLSQDNMICANYDKSGLTTQSIYNLKILKSPIPEFNHFFLLGLINSQLLSYYFIKMFGSYKKLFPRILIEKIRSLPIRLPQNPNELLLAKNIKENVKKILNSNNLSNRQFIKLQNEIDKSVFKLYQISPNKSEYISTFLKNL